MMVNFKGTRSAHHLIKTCSYLMVEVMTDWVK